MIHEDVPRWMGEVGVSSHGATYRSSQFDIEKAREELVTSKVILKEQTGRRVSYFVCSLGSLYSFPTAVVPIARSAGRESIFSSVSVPSGPAARALGAASAVEPGLGLPINLYFALQG